MVQMSTTACTPWAWCRASPSSRSPSKLACEAGRDTPSPSCAQSPGAGWRLQVTPGVRDATRCGFKTPWGRACQPWDNGPSGRTWMRMHNSVCGRWAHASARRARPTHVDACSPPALCVEIAALDLPYLARAWAIGHYMRSMEIVPHIQHKRRLAPTIDGSSMHGETTHDTPGHTAAGPCV
jgi:hypothetical protein